MNLAEIHENCLDVDNRIIYLHGSDLVEEQEPGVDYRMASMFVKNINFLSMLSRDPITIHMNTIGGEWSYGMAIYDAIKLCGCEVTIIAYSWARSMSSIILQAAHHRIMMPHASFMVHWGTSASEGHYLAVKSEIDFMSRTESVMIDIYANRCVNGEYFKSRNMNLDQVSAYIVDKIEKKADWWLTAEEAVSYGFADSVA